MFNFSKIENFQVEILNKSFNTNLNQIIDNNSDLHNHVITLYTGMSFFIISIIALIIICLTKFSQSHNKLSKKDIPENDIPKPALKLAKASRNKKSSE